MIVFIDWKIIDNFLGNKCKTQERQLAVIYKDLNEKKSCLSEIKQ